MERDLFGTVQAHLQQNDFRYRPDSYQEFKPASSDPSICAGKAQIDTIHIAGKRGIR